MLAAADFQYGVGKASWSFDLSMSPVRDLTPVQMKEVEAHGSIHVVILRTELGCHARGGISHQGNAKPEAWPSLASRPLDFIQLLHSLSSILSPLYGVQRSCRISFDYNVVEKML